MVRKKFDSDCSSGKGRPLHRFFVSPDAIRDDRVILEGRQARQIYSVLRLRTGDRIVALDNEGAEVEAQLEESSSRRILGRILKSRRAGGEPGVHLCLYQSILARNKFEWVLQKCTEVGVRRFVPVVTRRGIVQHPGVSMRTKILRWRRIIMEAAEQSHRAIIPELAEPATLDDAVADLQNVDCALVAATRADAANLRSCLAAAGIDNAAGVALVIGPEGGLTAEEERICIDAGARAFSLGPRILRSETAAVVGSAVVLYELGQMQNRPAH